MLQLLWHIPWHPQGVEATKDIGNASTSSNSLLPTKAGHSIKQSFSEWHAFANMQGTHMPGKQNNDTAEGNYDNGSLVALNGRHVSVSVDNNGSHKIRSYG